MLPVPSAETPAAMAAVGARNQSVKVEPCSVQVVPLTLVAPPPTIVVIFVAGSILARYSLDAVRAVAGEAVLPRTLGMKVMETLQTVPALLSVFPSTEQPVMPSTEYSVKPDWRAIDLMATAVLTVTVTLCVVDWPSEVDGNMLPATVNVGVAAWREPANERTKARTARLRATRLRRERGSANWATA